MASNKLFNFNNTYVTLPERFYHKVLPAELRGPKLLKFNGALASHLGLVAGGFSDGELAQIFSGQKILEGASPIATAYAGHQFGNFVPQLGDGRALLLGEIVNPSGKRFDIQLKGCGETPFSRRGDGKSALGPVIREYIVSEAMHFLGVPTTRALAAVSTGEMVTRETPQPGGILTRVAASHIRIGHFEYFAAQGDLEGLKALALYTIHRHYPEIKNQSDRYFLFLQKVIAAQASLVAHWMDIGFIHGVMNTDNMLISGETIDYGPCAFMDKFNFEQVFSSIDRGGRYSYINQPPIAQWNLARLADCLLMLVEDDASVIKMFENELVKFQALFQEHWLQRMRNKLGLLNEQPQDLELIKKWLKYLEVEKLDYTLSFRQLAEQIESNSAASEFHLQWHKRIQAQPFDNDAVKNKMNQVNPIYIPRNHQVERAIRGAVSGDLSVFNEMVEVLKNPFTEQSGFEIYKAAPRPEEQVCATFCGT